MLFKKNECLQKKHEQKLNACKKYCTQWQQLHVCNKYYTLFVPISETVEYVGNRDPPSNTVVTMSKIDCAWAILGGQPGWGPSELSWCPPKPNLAGTHSNTWHHGSVSWNQVSGDALPILKQTVQVGVFFFCIYFYYHHLFLFILDVVYTYQRLTSSWYMLFLQVKNKPHFMPQW